ncbi:MAG: hypothetical protein A3C80_03755 [Candidatus Ryanbacteria bacterium RIFCSPHIGHO2_02_FULL_45_43]|uniref:Thioredoxin domain-containing protein n=1 Tax=Candidatus Ryanbacteria bacterium RIFCSPHIGHO2_01_45_13 TaxID=1802112 RepID=A0A1G2FYI8_9BACT|nr:MAG: hypothetical protein A2718_03015 [Candidatus Ryanbacteria bacterium RIFCSPHIGHO2_01_FULL_44_130]OGZ43133.1 MAG: hypothetical protein A2W41_00360 [Candidatus Ryanbacteria bacterium RIFCSPHIGHO2_01_45_13]OGZ47792.1 MAG: hypothetical protein A3C80_03755 [Candidatus Ryanbacteria bacterium RIFCSPHIGHO2_02_FULL_45_43]OGZ49685.1 MAG: hypothetical protein A3E55_02210 [Candidatus Ryanbacteria bacterium RIFCSPHIGHO2_12_FULL_44_20]OGZ52178.1 MAG: hypothetical protein A3A17_03075 [Candidatus Ryanba
MTNEQQNNTGRAEEESGGTVADSNFHQSPYMIPISIIIAGLFISGAIMYSGGSSQKSPASTADAVDSEEKSDGDDAAGAARSVDNIRPVGAGDHILGSPDAPVKIVEYSDTECPFCKRFHLTLKQIIDADEYGRAGKVAWVYRHFPLAALHRKAFSEAQATECAAELGGNEQFWLYLDRLFEVTPSNDGLEEAELPRIAQYIGLDQEAFERCLTSGRHENIVNDDYDNAVASGGTGTPFSVVITNNGGKYIISGAQPYETVKRVIDQALSSN